MSELGCRRQARCLAAAAVRQRPCLVHRNAPGCSKGAALGWLGIALLCKEKGQRGWADQEEVFLTRAVLHICPQNTFIRKVKVLKAPKFDITKLMEVSAAAVVCTELHSSSSGVL